MPRRTDLVLATPQPLEQLVERAKTYTVDSRSIATCRAYLSDFDALEAWCASAYCGFASTIASGRG